MQSDTHDIIRLLLSKIKLIIGSMIAAFVVSCIVLLMMPNYYQASSIFYPISESMQQPIVDPTSENMRLYGDDGDVDRILSIAKSSKTKQALVDELDLYAYYNLSPSNKKDRIRMVKKLEKYYDVQKTEYDAIRIAYEDTDANKAADYANKAVQIVDRITSHISNDARQKLLKSISNAVADKQQLLDKISNQIYNLKEKYQIYDVDRQAEAIALIESKSPKSASIKETIKNYTAGVSQIMSLEVQQERISEELAEESNTLSKLQSHAQGLTSLHIIEPATAPDIKSRPKRSLLAIGATLMMGILMSLVVIVQDSFKRYA